MAEEKNDSFPDKSVAQDALTRLGDARCQKTEARKDVQEALFFTRPRLSYNIDSSNRSTKRRQEDDEDLATGIGAEVSEDFATEVVSAFFPEGTEWVTATPDLSSVGDLEKDEIAEIEADSKERNATIFAAIRSSNFDAVLGTSLDPHASVGTIAWWIDKPYNTRPTNVSHVPYRELEFNVEPDGSVGDRFRIRWVLGSRLKSVLPDVKIPSTVEQKIKNNKKCWIEVVWCFWRDWTKPEDDLWTHVILVDKIAVHEQTLEGTGCVPLIIARFCPDSEFAWGFGPSVKALQDYRVLDVITAATQDRVDIALAPPIGYPDDGVTDFEGGIEAGKAYPMRPGSGRDVTKLYFEGDADLGFYTATDIERRIRRKHFADYPEQKGDTPPTATQWIDEMVKSQRRIGTPGKMFWREGPFEIYRRFEWILKQDGKITDIEFNGQVLTLTPNNPATQAANNQKLQNGMQVLGIIKNYFPETAAAAVDERATIDNLKRLANDDVVVLRDAEQTKQLLGQVLGAAQDMGVVPQGGQQ